METEGNHSVIEKMKDHNIFDQVKTISKDRNNKTNKLLKDNVSDDLIIFNPVYFGKILILTRKRIIKAPNQMISPKKSFKNLYQSYISK